MLLLVWLVGALKLSEASCVFRQGTSDTDAFKLSFQTKSSENQSKTGLDETAAVGFDYVRFLDALERNDERALGVLRDENFNKMFALGALSASIQHLKEDSFVKLFDIIKGARFDDTRTQLLECFLKIIKDWHKSDILKRMKAHIENELDIRMNSGFSQLEGAFLKLRLLNLSKHCRWNELKAAFDGSKRRYFRCDAVICAIVHNNLKLLEDLLDDGFNPNTSYPNDYTILMEKIALETRWSLGHSKYTALMFAFFYGRGAAARIIAASPKTRIAYTLCNGMSALEIYKMLPSASKGPVYPALQFTNNNPHDTNQLKEMMCGFDDESLVDVILNDRPQSCVEAYLWKGMDYYSFDVLLAAVYKENCDVLETLQHMEWVQFDKLKGKESSLIFETLLLLPPGRFAAMVRKLVAWGFDFGFGESCVGDLYVPSVFDYMFTKKMSHGHIEEWLKLQFFNSGGQIPVLPIDHLIFVALETFDKVLLDIICENTLGSLLNYTNPITGEPLMFHVMRSYYPATRDLKFIRLMKEQGMIDLKQKQKAVCPIFQPQSKQRFRSGFLWQWAALFLSRPEICIHDRKVSKIEKGGDCTLENLFWAMEDSNELKESAIITLSVRAFEPINRDFTREYAIINVPRTGINQSDSDHYEWYFHSSLVIKDLAGKCGENKNHLKDDYGIGPEGNSAFHIIVSPRAAHNDDVILLKLIEYFAERKRFFVDFISLEGEKITYKNRNREIFTATTKGWTPFMVATARGKLALAEALVEYKANIYATTSSGLSFAREFLELKWQNSR
jgi:hypothetical protein